MPKNQHKIYGVLGYPVTHSLSPLMHNAAFTHLGIDAEYVFFEKSPEELEAFLHSLKVQGIYGINVTIPYKEKVIPYLSFICEDAKLIGAVNTIIVGDGGLVGFNTDGEGFLRHLNGDLGFQVTQKKVAILGAGGASRAVSVMVSRQKPKTLFIFDVDSRKQDELIQHLKGNFPDVIFHCASSIDQLLQEGADLLINTTPVGMKPNDPCLVDEKYLHKDMLVYDLIYNPQETKLLTLARQRGARVANGLGMLLYQGMLAFTKWTNQAAPYNVMSNALQEGIKKL